MKTNAGNLKKGDFVYYNAEIYQVQKAEFYSPGKGSALMRTKLKNLVTGKNVDYTYKSQETLESLEVESIEMQYLYKDAELVYFMNERDYQQYSVPLSVVGDTAKYMKEGNKYFVYMNDEKPLNVRAAASERLQVIETEEAAKGDTVSGAKKPAVVETGATVMVPLFVKKGDT
ncbi:elongation factor P, partial [Candidatus Microgenomates bacterium]|nr:elongation factor P [Candidatus Microgenomates bacterium]